MKKLFRAAFALLALSLCAPVSAPVAAADKFATFVDTVSGQGRRAVAVTPSDTTDLTDVPKALFVGSGGNITMIGVDASGDATGVVWKNVAAGSIIPFRPRRILATGTTAADIVAIY